MSIIYQNLPKKINVFNTYSSFKEGFNSSLDFVSEQERKANFFITLANYKERVWRSEFFEFQDVLMFDIDSIDHTRFKEYLTASEKALGINIEETICVSTGNGLHIIIKPDGFMLTNPEDFKKLRKYYLGWCDALTEELKAQKLSGEVDEGVFQVGISTRVPGGQNCKPMRASEYKTIKEVLLIKNNLQDIEWDFSLKCRRDKQEKEALIHWGKVDKETIKKECLFLSHCYANQSEVKEAEWFMAVGLASRFEDAREECHALSKDYPGYSFEETEQKYEYSVNYNPPNCETINEKWGKCSSCPHFKKVHSPLQIKSKNYIATQDTGFSVLKKGGKYERKVEDLRSYFEIKHPYVTLAETSLVYIFNGTHYEASLDSHLKSFAQEHYIPVCEKESERVEFIKSVKSCNIILTKELSGQECNYKINLKNGVYDFKEDKLLPHSKDYYFTYCLPYEFSPEAGCPTWEELMKNVTLDRPLLQDALEEYIGYCLSGSEYIFNKFLGLAGEGANGKSTVLKTIEALLGSDNISSVAPENFGNSFATSSFFGKLANICDEVSPNAFKNPEVIKQLTGGASLQAERKFEQSFSFKNRAKIIVSFNRDPYFPDRSKGLMRRLLFIPFELDLIHSPDKKIENIDYKLSQELPGIFNRCMRAYKRLLAKGEFTIAEEITEKVNQLRIDSDVVEEIMRELVVAPNSKVYLHELYEFMDREVLKTHDNEQSMSFRKFCKRVREIMKRDGRLLYYKRENNSNSRKFYIEGYELSSKWEY